MEQEQMQFQTPQQPQAERPPPGGTPVALSQQRPRGRTACGQCSRRKIRCDAYDRMPLNQACSNCTKRGQPDQCTLNDDAPRSGTKRARPSEGGDRSPAAPRPKKEPGARAVSTSFLDGIHSASATYAQPPLNGYPGGGGVDPYATKTYNVIPAAQYPQAAPPQQHYQPAYAPAAPLAPPLTYGNTVPDINDLLPAHKSALR